MNSILRAAVRLNTLKALAVPVQQSSALQTTGITRSLWHMSNKGPAKPIVHNSGCMGGCSCGCGSRRFASTNGESALVDFLKEEIEAEKANVASHLPSQVDGFQIKYTGADVELTKQASGEKIVIKFNVNHTVDAEENEDDAFEGQQSQQQESAPPKLQSKPNFEIDIVKKDTTLSLSCSYLHGKAGEGEYDDIFGIEELTIFKGEHNETVYACAGDMLDGYFYDLLMNLISEKGITDEFVSKLSELATQYEQSLFLNLLQETKKFFETK